MPASITCPSIFFKSAIYYMGYDSRPYVKIEEYILSFFLRSHFIFYFSISRTLGLGLGVICRTVTSVTSDGVVTALITKLERSE